MEPSKKQMRLIGLTSLVQERCPRELRDIVYSYLWDEIEVRKVGYPAHLTKTRRCSNWIHDDHGNVICMCPRPITIPPFARAFFVGFMFAHEAVDWFYKNHEKFTLDSSAQIHAFITTDVFHVSLTPGISRIHRLAINIDLVTVSSQQGLQDTQTHLAALRNLSTRPTFQLDINLKPARANVEFKIYELAGVLEIVQPIVATIERTKETKVQITYSHHLIKTMDVKHMPGSLKEELWIHFIEKELQPQLLASTMLRPGDAITPLLYATAITLERSVFQHKKTRRILQQIHSPTKRTFP